MGRWIDRTVFTAATAFALYMLFVSAFGSITAACCITFLSCALLFRLRQGRGEKYHMTKLQAQTIIENWAFEPDEETEKQIHALLCDRAGEIVYLPKHPTATLSLSDTFSAWRSHRDAEKIIVVTACCSDGRARTFAASLQSPSVEIMDAIHLIPIVRRSNLTPPRTLRGRQLFRRLKSLLLELPTRRPWHRNLLYGLGLMLVYLMTGSAAYLILSIGTLFIAGIGIRIHA